MTKIPPLPPLPQLLDDLTSKEMADEIRAYALSAQLATWNAAIEAAAGQWDGCEYEGVGERIDIASAIRFMKEPQ